MATCMGVSVQWTDSNLLGQRAATALRALSPLSSGGQIDAGFRPVSRSGPVPVRHLTMTRRRPALFGPRRAAYNEAQHRWKFTDGRVVRFGSLQFEHDVQGWQGQ